MTGLLPTVLRERADTVAPPQLDVAAIVADGDRRVRRTRVRAGLALAGGVTTLAVGAAVLPGLLGAPAPDPDRSPAASPASAPFEERRVGYATGSTIHWGDEDLDVLVEVASYVQTDQGFVVATATGEVYFFDGTVLEQIGASVDRELRADDTGPLVAWVSAAGPGRRQYVVYDTDTRREVRVDDDTTGTSPAADDGGPTVYAVDDGAVYWRTGEGLVRYDVAAGRTALLSAVQRTPENPETLPRAIVDVAAGTIAWNLTDLEGTRVFVGDRIGPDGRELATGYNGSLSPDGRVAAVEEGDQTRLYDTRSGAELSLGVTEPYRFVYGWVDADTAMVLAHDPDARTETATADLLACDVREGTCRAAASVSLRNPTWALPNGTPMS